MTSIQCKNKMIGSTVPAIGGIDKCFPNGDLWMCECVQIYTTKSRRWDIETEPNCELVKKFKKAQLNSNVKVVVSHVPFLVNLCSTNPIISEKSKNRLLLELAHNNKLGINFTVLHPGSNPNKSKGIKMIAMAINSVLNHIKDNSCYILLETMAGQGNSIGSNFEELAQILNRIEKKEQVGICLDTAHIFQAGYDILNKQSYDNVFGTFDQIIGIEKIKVIHLNDSKSSYFSCVDRHAFLGEGKIGLNFFKNILYDDRFSNIPMIMELPDIDRSPKALQILKEL